jgi:hypothetical protein
LIEFNLALVALGTAIRFARPEHGIQNPVSPHGGSHRNQLEIGRRMADPKAARRIGHFAARNCHPHR